VGAYGVNAGLTATGLLMFVYALSGYAAETGLAWFRITKRKVNLTLLDDKQGLTLVHFSAQLEPCLTHKSTLHTLHTPQHLLNMGLRTPTRTPCPMKSAQVEPRSERV